jgi:hypothetical protein
MPVAVSRRALLSAAAACTTANLAAAQPSRFPPRQAGEGRSGAGGTKVALLGTKGGPRVNKGRANPSNLVDVRKNFSGEIVVGRDLMTI